MPIDYERIRKEPTYPRIQFIDGYVAKAISIIPTKDNGVDGWLVDLEPFEELVKRYKIKSDEQYIQRFFPIENIIPLSIDPIWTVYLCITTFNNEETPATYQLKGITQIKQIAGLKEEINRILSEKAKVERKLDLAQRNFPQYIKENLGTLMEVAGPMLRTMILDNANNPNSQGGGM